MGNRAVIIGKNANQAIYLHWNGGRDSVGAFLHYCQLLDLPGLDGPSSPGLPGLVAVLINFFGNTGRTVSIFSPAATGKLEDLDPGDNGIYIIEGWQIKDRIKAPRFEQSDHDMNELLQAIDHAQPTQLGNYLTAKEIPAHSLEIGDIVYSRNHGDIVPKEYPVIGFGTVGTYINGTDVTGLPYISRWGDSPETNINNYIRSASVKIASA